MKKFYFLAAVAAVAVSASAQLPVSTDLAARRANVPANAVELNLPALPAAEISAKAEITAPEVAGAYTWEYYSYLGNGGVKEMMIEFVAINDTEMSFKLDVAGDEYDILVNVSPDGKISIPRQVLWTEQVLLDEVEVAIFHTRWNDDGKGFYTVDEPVVGQYENGVITFDEMDNICVNAEQEGYWYYVNGDNRMERYVEGNWVNCGTATYIDGWILPAYGADQWTMPVDVLVEYNDAHDGDYRLVDPFKGEHPVYVKGNNESDKVGYIVFNISDPEFPYIYPNVEAGYADEDYTAFYCKDLNGYYFKGNGISKEIIFANVEAEDLSTYNEETKIMNIPTCGFGINGAEGKFYGWTDAEMTGQIDLSGIDKGALGNVAADNAPVVYYNLQGMRVENPNNGIYIRRQGNTAVKVRVVR